MKLTGRRDFLNTAAISFAAAGMVGLPKMLSGETVSRPNSELSSLRSADEWINSEALTEMGLRGKVVLIHFWTYTCINWMRTLPYVRAWSEKYKDKGLVVIGVHTPEFSFEQDIDNVRLAVKQLRVNYPVAIDNKRAIWNAFDNNYWPALYLLDAKGRIRHHQFGEGGYEAAEKNIQQLLLAAGAAGIGQELTPVVGQGKEAAADWNNLRSPENYLGYGRTENFVSSGGMALDKASVYMTPVALRLNDWGLSGHWKVLETSIVLGESGGKIIYQFHARDLHLVMGPAAPGKQVRFRVLIDGVPPGAAHGVDVDDQGNGMLIEQRMYQLLRQQDMIKDRLFEIEFLDQGAEAFSFTFG